MLKKGIILETAFEEYVIKEQIGQGGNGTVFLANTTIGDTSTAIKIIDKNTTSKDKVKRFRNEVNFCQKNTHPNIINVLDYGTYRNGNKDCLFYVMPYYESTLKKEIEKGIDPKRIIDIFTQILKGLEFAHQKGVWHRDIKPENILYNTKTNAAIVADFGIAHFCEEDIVTAVETKAVERLANYLYAAPEQRIKGKSVDGRADIFALGLILNEMFTKTVISGAKYKKIKDYFSEYAFLDSVVEELIGQDQNDRLYPIERVLIEIITRLKVETNKIELRKIVEEKIDSNVNEEIMSSPPNVTNLEFEENNLIIHLNKITTPEWNNILITGQYSHNSLMSYPTHSFTARNSIDGGHTAFIVNIRTNDDNVISSIVNNFKSWLPTVNEMYLRIQKQRREAKIRQDIEIREREIKAKESEIRIREQLKSLI